MRKERDWGNSVLIERLGENCAEGQNGEHCAEREIGEHCAEREIGGTRC